MFMVQMNIPISNVDLRLVPGEWSFAVERRAEIEQLWDKALAGNPALWNGRVLMAKTFACEDGRVRADMLETDFASYLAWRDWEFPDISAFNIFGSAIVVSRDGAVVLGRMAPQTVSPGYVDVPGGSLDLSDIREGGTVDIFGSTARELEEEMGLRMEEGRLGERFVVIDKQYVSVSSVVHFDLDASDLVAHINARLAGRPDHEFDRIFAITEMAELEAKVARTYVVRSVERVLSVIGDP